MEKHTMISQNISDQNHFSATSSGKWFATFFWEKGRYTYDHKLVSTLALSYNWKVIFPSNIQIQAFQEVCCFSLEIENRDKQNVILFFSLYPFMELLLLLEF